MKKKPCSSCLKTHFSMAKTQISGTRSITIKNAFSHILRYVKPPAEVWWPSEKCYTIYPQHLFVAMWLHQTKHFTDSVQYTLSQMKTVWQSEKSSRSVCALLYSLNRFNICWNLWNFFFNILAHFKYTVKNDHFFIIHTL